MLSAAIKQGIPLNTKFPSPNPITVNEHDYTTCGGGPVGSAMRHVPQRGHRGGTYNVYIGTRGVGQHVLRAAGAADRAL